MKIIIRIVKKSNDNIWENQATSISFKSFHSNKLKESYIDKNNKSTNIKENQGRSQNFDKVKNNSSLSEPILINKSNIINDQNYQVCLNYMYYIDS